MFLYSRYNLEKLSACLPSQDRQIFCVSQHSSVHHVSCTFTHSIWFPGTVLRTWDVFTLNKIWWNLAEMPDWRTHSFIHSCTRLFGYSLMHSVNQTALNSYTDFLNKYHVFDVCGDQKCFAKLNNRNFLYIPMQTFGIYWIVVTQVRHNLSNTYTDFWHLWSSVYVS